MVQKWLNNKKPMERISVLKVEIARELTETSRNNVAIDWTLKESIQAKMRVMVKPILKRYGYPCDKQKKTTETVLEQAALINRDLVEVKNCVNY
jgi:hypothetical protein